MGIGKIPVRNCGIQRGSAGMRQIKGRKTRNPRVEMQEKEKMERMKFIFWGDTATSKGFSMK